MPRVTYYWIVCDYEGQTSLLPGGDTEEEARLKGLEQLPGHDFQIKKLHTKNMALASQELKGRRLAETHSLREARQRLLHNRGLKRLRERVNRRS